MSGTDISWGAAASIAQTMGISPVDLDMTSAAVAWEGPPAARLEQAEAAWQRTQQASMELEQSVLFSELGRRMIVFGVYAFWCGARIHCLLIFHI